MKKNRIFVVMPNESRVSIIMTTVRIYTGDMDDVCPISFVPVKSISRPVEKVQSVAAGAYWRQLELHALSTGHCVASLDDFAGWAGCVGF